MPWQCGKVMQAGQMGKNLACVTWNEPFGLGLGGELEVGPRGLIQGLCCLMQVPLSLKFLICQMGLSTLQPPREP